MKIAKEFLVFSCFMEMLNLLSGLAGGEQYKCGERKISPPTRRRRIVGGDEAVPGTWPWAVWISKAVSNGSTYLSAGVLVSRYTVYTVAHSFYNVKDYTLTLIFANQAVTLHNAIRYVHIHPKYNQEDIGRFYDFAKITMPDPINFTDYIIPICLPERHLLLGCQDASHADLHDGTPMQVAGWGNLGPNQFNEELTLREASIPYIPIARCQQDYYQRAIPNVIIICAGANGRSGLCMGDSGGPLMTYNRVDQRYFLHGIGMGAGGSGTCPTDKPSIFFDVALAF